MSEARKLTEEIEEARKLAFDDFASMEGEARKDAVKVVDTISRLELDNRKYADELRLKEEEAEFKYQQDEKDEIRKQERHEAELKKMQEELELARKNYNLNVIRTGAEIAGGATGLGISVYHLKGMFKVEEKPFGVPRGPYEVLKKLVDNASRGFGKLRFK